MGRAALLILVGVLALGACGGDDDEAAGASGDKIVIRTKLAIAASPGSEPIATGDVLAGSKIGGDAFCAGGTILDSHANRDPAMESYGQIARTITCPDGTVKIGLTPDPATGTGTWTIVSGTGAYDALRGSGELKTVYNADDSAVGRETLTGTVSP